MKNKDYFISKTASDLNIPETTIELVINSTFKDLIRTVSYTDCYEAEISGLGVLKLNISKSQKKLDRLYDNKKVIEQKLDSHNSQVSILSSEEVSTLQKRLKEIHKHISYIELKYNTSKSNEKR